MVRLKKVLTVVRDSVFIFAIAMDLEGGGSVIECLTRD